MVKITQHEEAYRGSDFLNRLGATPITVCGAGALGSNLVDNLTRQGAKQIRAIDFDRVEAANAGTQVYRQEDAGGFKVDVLKNHCFRSVGVEVEPVRIRMDPGNVGKGLKGSGLVVDTFDNSESRGLVREYCAGKGIACLHLGMNADYGEARWNEVYAMPGDTLAGNACEVPLARNLILILVAVGCEAILRFIGEQRKENYSITLKDLSIRKIDD
jgi:molybdopterin-synthase adenylyltransferase